MITREFEYMARLSDMKCNVGAELSWSCSNKYGEYINHTFIMSPVKSGNFNVAKEKALEVMKKDYPNATFRVRNVFSSCIDNKFYLQFLVDVIE